MKRYNFKKISSYILLLLIFISSTVLFSDMMVDRVHSDFSIHFELSMEGKGYSLMKLIMVSLYTLTESTHSIAVFFSLLVTFGTVVCALCLKRLLKLMNTNADFYELLIISALGIFICKLCIPDLSPYYYHNSLVTQPWHNSTYLLMRFFAPVVISLFFSIQKNYVFKVSALDLLSFTFFLFMTNFSKPNFVIAFAPVMLFVLIKDFFKTKTKSFKNAFLFGMCVILGCSIMIYQNNALYPKDGDVKVFASLSVFTSYLRNNKKWPLDFFLNMAFPIAATYVTLKNRRRIDSYSMKVFYQSWAMYIMSLLEFLFIDESGYRAGNYNFRWGEQFFAFYLFIICACMIIKQKKEATINDRDYFTLKHTYILHIVFGASFYVLLVVFKYLYLTI